MIRLKDIAESTGVSVSVVSRALNPKPDKNAFVSDFLRGKINKAARELGYRPNRMAEFLKRGKNAALGVFVPKLPNRLIADLMFGISSRAVELNFPINFHFGISCEEYTKFIDTVCASNSGIITYPYNFLVEPEVNTTIVRYLENGGHVVVLSSLGKPEVPVPVVYIDSYHGGKIAAEHLLGCGCCRFMVSSNYNKRTEGFVQTLGLNGVKGVVFDDAKWEQALNSVFKRRGGTVGIFATSDQLAIKIMGYLQNNHLAFGKDVFLVGYDDLDTVQYLNPPLTTIHQPFREMGEASVRKVVNMIYGKREKSECILPCLVKRGTA